MNLTLQNIKFTSLNFYNTTEKFENVELQIDINQEVKLDESNKNLCVSIIKISIYPKIAASLNGEFSIRAETTAVCESNTELIKIDAKLRNETFNVIYPYIRATISSLMTSAHFPPFYLPLINNID